MPFEEGQSGNPSGRPKGAKDRRTVFRDMVELKAPELINKAIDMALDGNEQMLRLLLERILPAKPKDEHVMLNIYADNIMEQCENIYNALSMGDISPSEAKLLMSNIVSQRQLRNYANADAICSKFGVDF